MEFLSPVKVFRPKQFQMTQSTYDFNGFFKSEIPFLIATCEVFLMFVFFVFVLCAVVFPPKSTFEPKINF